MTCLNSNRTKVKQADLNDFKNNLNSTYIMFAKNIFSRLQLVKPFWQMRSIFTFSSMDKTELSQRLRNYLIGQSELSIQDLAFAMNNPDMERMIVKQSLIRFRQKQPPSQIQKLCKLVMPSQSFRHQNFYIINQFYERNIQHLLQWKELENPEFRLFQLRIINNIVNGKNKQVIDYVKGIDYLKLPNQHALQIYTILSLMGQHSTKLEQIVSKMASQLAKAQFSKQNMSAATQLLRINSYQQVLSKSTIRNYFKFIQNHIQHVDEAMLDLIIRGSQFDKDYELKSLLSKIQKQVLSLNPTFQYRLLLLVSGYHFDRIAIIQNISKHPQKFQPMLQKESLSGLLRFFTIFRSVKYHFLPQVLSQIIIKRILNKLQNAHQIKNVKDLSIAFYLLNKIVNPPLNQTLISLEKLPLGQILYKFQGQPNYLSAMLYLIVLYSKIHKNKIKYLAKSLENTKINENTSELVAIFQCLLRLNIQIPFKFTLFDLRFENEISPEEKSSNSLSIHNYSTYNRWKNIFQCFHLSQLYKNHPQKCNFLKRIESLVEQHLRSQAQFDMRFLYNVLEAYSTCKDTNKFLYSIFETRLIQCLKKDPSQGNEGHYYKLFRGIVELLKNHKIGSRKLHIFIKKTLKNPEDKKKFIEEYYQRQQKFQQLRQKQRIDKISTKRQASIQEKKRNFKDKQK